MREGTAGNQAGDALARVREQNVRAVCAEAVRHLGAFDAVDGENTALLYFTEERGFFAQRSGHGHTQHHFINAFRLPVFLENLRRVRRFKRDIFGIDTLDLEGHFGAVLF